MKVISFPNLRNAAHTDDEYEDPTLDGDDQEAFYDTSNTATPPNRNTSTKAFAHQAKPRPRRPTPTDILANALSPPHRSSGSARMSRATPAEVIASALYPSLYSATQELLRRSFWDIWLQHSDYLKKKAFTS